MICILNPTLDSVIINLKSLKQKAAYDCFGWKLIEIPVPPYELKIAVSNNIELSYILDTYKVEQIGIAAYPDEIEFIKEDKGQIIIKFVSEGKLLQFIGEIKKDNDNYPARWWYDRLLW